MVGQPMKPIALVQRPGMDTGPLAMWVRAAQLWGLPTTTVTAPTLTDQPHHYSAAIRTHRLVEAGSPVRKSHRCVNPPRRPALGPPIAQRSNNETGRVDVAQGNGRGPPYATAFELPLGGTCPLPSARGSIDDRHVHDLLEGKEQT